MIMMTNVCDDGHNDSEGHQTHTSECHGAEATIHFVVSLKNMIHSIS